MLSLSVLDSGSSPVCSVWTVQSGFVNKFNRLIETITLKRTIRLGIASLLHAREWTKEKQAFKFMTCQVLQVQVEQAAFYCNYYYYGSTSLVSHSAKPEHRTTEVNPSCDESSLFLMKLSCIIQPLMTNWYYIDPTYMQSSVWRFYPENITLCPHPLGLSGP